MILREIASSSGVTRSRASAGPDTSGMSVPSSAWGREPMTGASTSGTPRAAAAATSRFDHSTPTVLIWSQTASSPIAGSAVRITSSTTGPSASIVITTDAPETASDWLAATSAPRRSAAAAVRFQTRTPNPGLHETGGPWARP